MTEPSVASLSLWRDRFVFTSPRFSGERSCRPATVILVGTDGELEVEVASGRYSGRGFLIGANVERSVQAHATGLYSLNLDPSNAYSRSLNDRVGITGVLNLDARLDLQVLAATTESVTELQGCAEVYRNSQHILNALFPDIVGTQPIDPRIDIVASWLWHHIPPRADLPFLAALCGLSQSRLAHVFTEQMGISIRQYLLWVKMRAAAEMFVRNLPLSHVAHEIGFADSSHLSRTFMRYFALTPSFLANQKLVRMQICESSIRS